MEAEISLLMANQTLVNTLLLSSISTLTKTSKASPGKLIYDPFVGTGSMAYVRETSFKAVVYADLGERPLK